MSSAVIIIAGLVIIISFFVIAHRGASRSKNPKRGATILAIVSALILIFLGRMILKWGDLAAAGLFIFIWIPIAVVFIISIISLFLSRKKKTVYSK